MIPLKVTEGLIRQHTDSGSFARGMEYYRHGAVAALARRGSVLEAEVEGSEPLPYRVRVEFDGDGVTQAACTCPYDWGGWCKHVAAALLACAHEPNAVEERPTLESLLTDLDREQLRQLLVSLVEHDRGLADVVESQVALLRARPTEPTSPAPGAARVRRVAEAAIESHPEWVIRACRQQAEGIMNEGRAEYYANAAAWLAKAKQAYRALGRESEWQAYLDDLLARHARKYKLRPMLEALNG